MIWNKISIENAEEMDARWIAELSRDYIEFGMGWNWTANRVLKSIYSPSSLVVKASIRAGAVGFGIMSYRREKANLNLLAVSEDFRRRGVGKKIVSHLEKQGVDWLIENFYVQMREDNIQAQKFYESLGYEMIDRNARYYKRKLPALIYYKYCPKLDSSRARV